MAPWPTRWLTQWQTISLKPRPWLRQRWLWPKEKVNGDVRAVLYNFSSDDTSPFYISFHLLQQIRCRNVYWQWEVEQREEPRFVLATSGICKNSEHRTTYRTHLSSLWEHMHCSQKNRNLAPWADGTLYWHNPRLWPKQTISSPKCNAMEEKPYKSSLFSSGYTNCTSWNLNWKGNL